MILNTAPFCDKNEKNWSHEITFTVPLIYRCHNCNCNSTYNDLLPYIKIDVTEIEFADNILGEPLMILHQTHVYWVPL